MAKIKKKTRKAIAKRFKRTGTGKLMRPMSGRGHLLSSKNKKRKRHLRSEVQVPSAFAIKWLKDMPK